MGKIFKEVWGVKIKRVDIFRVRRRGIILGYVKIVNELSILDVALGCGFIKKIYVLEVFERVNLVFC